MARSKHSDDRFANRDDAGRRLATLLAERGLTHPVVLALPRGGVPVAAAIAERLGVGFDLLVARKVGAPGHPEFGIGAVGEGGVRVSDPATLARLGISAPQFGALAGEAEAELQRRVGVYRGERALPALEGADVIVVDDGLATGVTAEAAIATARAAGARRVIVAVPVAAADSARRLAGIADEVVSVITAEVFRAVGTWYDEFPQLTDDEVLAALP